MMEIREIDWVETPRWVVRRRRPPGRNHEGHTWRPHDRVLVVWGGGGWGVIVMGDGGLGGVGGWCWLVTVVGVAMVVGDGGLWVLQ